MLNGGVGDEQNAEKMIVSSGYTDVSSVSIDKSDYTIAIGNSVRLTAVVLPSSAVNKNVSWISSDPETASVDIYGNVTAKTAGTAIITVITEDGNKTAQCTVNVTNPTDVEYITFANDNAVKYELGDEAFVNCEIYPTNARNQDIVWSSDNTKVLTVDDNGLLKAVGVGSAVITASTADRLHSVTWEVSVEDGMSVHTKTSLSSVGNFYLLTVSADSIPDGAKILVAGYSSAGMMICSEYVNNMQAIFEINKNIAYFKTFVWTSDMQPLSRAGVTNVQ